MKILLMIFTLACLSPNANAGWGFGNDPGKVLLRDVQVLTLKSGQMTTGRRSSPVPQLKCVGGSAQGHFNPQVVQCYNRGWDGMDVQWECKTDMDNLYRFGSVEVVCEGYDYPEDPYITKGSCGLEYTLELTNEGRNQQGGSYYQSSYNNYNYKKSSSSGFGDLIVLAVMALVIYAMYKTCIDNGNQNMGDRQYSSTSNDYPGGAPGGSPGGGGGWFNPGGNHRQNYNQGFDDGSCGANGPRRHGTGGGGGFWTGLGTGGLLGYMFGAGGNRGYYGNRWGGGYNQGYHGYGGGWGGGTTRGFTTGFGGGGGGGGSTGTRSASGYGGTRRR